MTTTIDSILESEEDYVIQYPTEILEIDPNLLTDEAMIVPSLSSSHYEAVKARIAKDGQMHPVLITADWKVHDGRLRRRACEELGIKVEVRYITEAKARACWLASCAQREWTIPDRARLIAHIREQKLYLSMDRASDEKRTVNDRIANFIRSNFGWKREVNTGKQVQRFLKLYSIMLERPDDFQQELSACGNLNAALRLFSQPRRKICKTPSLSREYLGEKWIEAYGNDLELNGSQVGLTKAVINVAVGALVRKMGRRYVSLMLTELLDENQRAIV
jgi:hypothetical protein